MQLNSTKPFAGLFALGAVIYAVYTLSASDPLTKMDRICTPFTLWPEKALVAGAKVFAPSYVPALQTKFDDYFSNCRRVTWNLLYADEYRKLQQEQAAQEQAAQPALKSSGKAISHPEQAGSASH